MADFQDSRSEFGASPRGDRRPSFDVVLRKFFREVQQSRVLSEVKKRRFHTKDVSRRLRRISARRKAVRKRAKRGY
ncbi:30S ribosomal protein S21 [Candidatus Berkelbacteria bacterium]|nr:30S ribosomal protein S21 [Candidatus Berkelbacteria bacterium]